MLQPFNDRFKAAIDYRTQFLEDRSQNNDDDFEQRISEWIKRLTVQLNSQKFDAEKTITMMNSLNDIQLGCPTN